MKRTKIQLVNLTGAITNLIGSDQKSRNGICLRAKTIILI